MRANNPKYVKRGVGCAFIRESLLVCNFSNSCLSESLTLEVTIKACVRYFHHIFISSPNDSPSKTMKNAFYFF